MKQKIARASFAAFLVLMLTAMLPLAGMAADTAASSAPGKPLIMWYSRGGTSQLVAETIQKALGGCDMDRIPSTKERGILTIMGEQYFGSADEQVKYPKSLAGYNPVFICAPIYFRKPSAPARAFMELNRDDLKGKDIYLFFTLAGKLDDGKRQDIKDFGASLGLNIKAVTTMPSGKKEEFPGRIKEFFGNYPQAKAAK